MRTGIAAVAVSVLVFAPAFTALAFATSATATSSGAAPASSRPNDGPDPTRQADPASRSGDVHAFLTNDGDPGEDSDENEDGDGSPSSGRGGPGAHPAPTTPPTPTTSIPAPTPTTSIPTPTAPTTTSTTAPTPTTSIPTPTAPTTTPTTAPAPAAPTPTTSIPSPEDDESSDDDPVVKDIGSVSKPPTQSPDEEASSAPSTTTPASVDEAKPTGAVFSLDIGGTDQTSKGPEPVMDENALRAADLISAPAVLEPPERAGGTASMVVLSWLVERDSVGPSAVILSPLVVLLTIWDAAASAGSGLAAPASGLGTFVLLVLFEKGHLANGVFRRRAEV